MRWGNHTFREVDDMLLSEWSSLNESFEQHPPVDLLVAGYLGYKSSRNASNVREAATMNAKALQSMRIGRMKTIDQMPEFVRSPEKMAIIQRMKAEAGGETYAG